MADYGFKVMRDKSKKTTGAGVVLDAKNPMLGFALGKKPATYFTVHISDTTTNDFASSGTPGYVEPTVPTGSDLKNMTSPYISREELEGQGTLVNVYEDRSLYGINKVSGVVRELVYEKNHMLGFTPAYTVTFSGRLVESGTYRNIGIPVSGYFNTISPLGTYSYAWAKMAPFDNTMTRSITDGMGVYYLTRMDNIPRLTDHLNAWDIPVADNSAAWYIQYAVADNLTSPESYGGPTEHAPYEVEVDDESVRIYRCYAWAENYGRVYRRCYQRTYEQGEGYWTTDASFDARLRQKMVSQTAGTELDITIMLMPYSLEDL